MYVHPYVQTTPPRCFANLEYFRDFACDAQLSLLRPSIVQQHSHQLNTVCVSEAVDHGAEVTMCNATLLDAPIHRRTRYGRKKAQLAKLYHMSTATEPKPTGKRRRIKRLASSSSSEEDTEDGGVKRDRGKNAPVLISSSDDEKATKKVTFGSDRAGSGKDKESSRKMTYSTRISDDSTDDSSHNPEPSAATSPLSQGFTQLPSLQSRVKARLDGNNTRSPAKPSESRSLKSVKSRVDGTKLCGNSSETILGVRASYTKGISEGSGSKQSNLNEAKSMNPVSIKDNPQTVKAGVQRRMDSSLQGIRTFSKSNHKESVKPSPVANAQNNKVPGSKTSTKPTSTLSSVKDNTQTEASFSLDFEEDLEDFDDSIIAGFGQDSLLQGSKTSKSPHFKDPNLHVPVTNTTTSTGSKRSAPATNKVSSSTSKAPSGKAPNKVSPPIMSREERLRLCRQRQEEFKRKHSTSHSVAIGTWHLFTHKIQPVFLYLLPKLPSQCYSNGPGNLSYLSRSTARK